jgi:cation diffusion facilitator family transporter
MSAHCHDDHCHPSPAHASPRYRRVLWIALVVNAIMFAVELWAGFGTGSVSLLADAIDFFGDAANYGVSLAVLTMALAWRARAAFVKGICMLVFGLFVIGKALWAARTGTPPEAFTMGAISLLALAANVGVAAILYAWREGDANMRSVWLCSRNDAVGNVAVFLAALGVQATGSAWPDLAVAFAMGALAVSSAWAVLRQASAELKVTV